jgi:hypothetical protein
MGTGGNGESVRASPLFVRQPSRSCKELFTVCDYKGTPTAKTSGRMGEDLRRSDGTPSGSNVSRRDPGGPAPGRVAPYFAARSATSWVCVVARTFSIAAATLSGAVRVAAAGGRFHPRPPPPDLLQSTTVLPAAISSVCPSSRGDATGRRSGPRLLRLWRHSHG